MKTKKPTKKQIIVELRSLDCTRIHRIAAKCGVNANKKYEVKEFCREHAPSARLYNLIAMIVSMRGLDRFVLTLQENSELTAARICRGMRQEIKSGASNYSKILIEGNANIYWASPVYLHADYNKSRAMPNTERNREVKRIINNYLAKHGIK